MSWQVSQRKFEAEARALSVDMALRMGWRFRAYCPGCRAYKDVATHRLEDHLTATVGGLRSKLRCLCGVRASRLQVIRGDRVMMEIKTLNGD